MKCNTIGGLVIKINFEYNRWPLLTILKQAKGEKQAFISEAIII